jgi:hypothetical protein
VSENNPTTVLLDRWVYDVERILRNALDVLSDDLSSEDVQTAELAAAGASEILDWLYPPPQPLSAQERLKRATNAINSTPLLESERIAALQRIARSSGCRRGRPRTETSQHAIRAFTLHLATPLSWREIALRVKGCNHKRRDPQRRSCVHCGDAIRDAAGRLEKFLRTKGYWSDFPRRMELEQHSNAAPAKVPKSIGANSPK